MIIVLFWKQGSPTMKYWERAGLFRPHKFVYDIYLFILTNRGDNFLKHIFPSKEILRGFKKKFSCNNTSWASHSRSIRIGHVLITICTSLISTNLGQKQIVNQFLPEAHFDAHTFQSIAILTQYVIHTSN